MKYYIECKGLLDKELNISFEEVKQFFFKIYKYFSDMNYFEAAINGVWITPQWGEQYQEIPPLFGAAPEIFFMNHLRSSEIYPIYEYYESYTEDELFSVIEILYDKIAVYDYKNNTLEIKQPRNEFSTQINNVLKFYSSGYYLETNSGTICKGTNSAIKEMLFENLYETFDDDTMGKMNTAIKMYYRFDSNMELKKKAINILADILEPLREDLKNTLNALYEINKNTHDKLIFDIVNNFNVRHNNKRQNTEYEMHIWYDWMMQYYTSVIVTYYKLKKKIND